MQSTQQNLFGNQDTLDNKGERIPIEPKPTGFRLQYDHPSGKLYQGDAIDWLSSLEDKTIDLIFADPPYNIRKAQWDHFESQWSIEWIAQATRVLKPTGSMYVCGFSEILADIKYLAMKYFQSCRWIIWHYRNKANLGNDWGRSHESLVHFRKVRSVKLNIDDIRIPYGAHTLKYPSHPQAKTSQYGHGGKRQEV